MINDAPRLAATSPDDHTLTVEEAALRYEHAGHPRTIRTLQRYCAKGHLDSLRQETPYGDKYLITPASVARHIAQIEELSSTASRDESRLASTDVVQQNDQKPSATETPTSRDQPRHAAAMEEESSRYVGRLEGEVEFLRGQVVTKDAQIKELTERSRETNLLIGGLQRMLAPLLGSPDPHPPTIVNNQGSQAGEHAQP
jgi:hypothetical protein